MLALLCVPVSCCHADIAWRPRLTPRASLDLPAVSTTPTRCGDKCISSAQCCTVDYQVGRQCTGINGDIVCAVSGSAACIVACPGTWRHGGLTAVPMPLAPTWRALPGLTTPLPTTFTAVPCSWHNKMRQRVLRLYTHIDPVLCRFSPEPAGHPVQWCLLRQAHMPPIVSGKPMPEAGDARAEHFSQALA